MPYSSRWTPGEHSHHFFECKENVPGKQKSGRDAHFSQRFPLFCWYYITYFAFWLGDENPGATRESWLAGLAGRPQGSPLHIMLYFLIVKVSAHRQAQRRLHMAVSHLSEDEQALI